MTENEDNTVKLTGGAGSGSGTRASSGQGTGSGAGAGAGARRVVCPLVSRHIDFLGDPPF